VNLYAYVLNNPANFRDPTGRQRADRDRPGDIEWARGLKKAIDNMPTQPSCGCQSRPANPLLLAGGVAVLDGPQPGPTDIIAIAILIAAIATTPPAVPINCKPDNVIPFPRRREPLPPPPPPSGRGPACLRALIDCTRWANGDSTKIDRCFAAHTECVTTNVPVIFPNGRWVP
jgi:hypothetical protein